MPYVPLTFARKDLSQAVQAFAGSTMKGTRLGPLANTRAFSCGEQKNTERVEQNRTPGYLVRQDLDSKRWPLSVTTHPVYTGSCYIMAVG